MFLLDGHEPGRDEITAMGQHVLIRVTVGVLVLTATLRAQASGPVSAPATSVRIETVDDAGKPVANVDVYLFHERYPETGEENPQVIRIGPVKSDASGVAVMQIP